ncbi:MULTISPECIES: SDR family NAD(P)-dependent oxidoreductase [unclassified Pseudoalteromonas]|uniref:SDR family NAD(P)-dependent oxidoreductase n=1 Tax=unclassified Pseudoalteromonas TaxID=194690 RepID=UPI0025B4BBAA|nr:MULTISPECIES: SDR family NAD(P)-dependent oxidoreductase [unclassified Pseudoalteromonas]MDN3379169.1 SDR family NAD(P)-dependent oxidoreductase [Pseudoalteromonas sp. APC 3893]MDN3387664.1 SDR family NAD(P)-dependent oxidoreductase [Pseudoalteromonas sp. APC 4017]
MDALEGALEDLENKATTHKPIAIIGVSGFFPNGLDLASFQQALIQQHDFFKPIPSSHLPSESIKQRYGSFIDELGQFDNALFNISEAEAKYMDPRQHLLLMSAWRTMESASLHPFALKDKKVNVFIAAEGSPFASLAQQLPLSPYSALGVSSWSMANRLSHFFQFSGKSLVMDTGCTGTLTVIHEAMDALQTGQADYALIGAANLLYGEGAEGAYLTQESLGILGDARGCFPFQQQAAGFLPAEGAGTLLLKPLDRAVTDGDPIFGVMLASAVAHSSGFGNYAMPSAQAQADAIILAHQKAGIYPSSMTYLEAHGIASALGDSEEIRAFKIAESSLAASWGKSNGDLKVSTIKGNLGHGNCMSGFFSIVRTLAAFSAQKKLGIKDFNKLHPAISIDNTNIQLNGDNEPWDELRIDGEIIPRRAGINNYSAGGTNAFLLLEEYLEQNTSTQQSSKDDIGTSKDGCKSNQDFYLALSVPDQERFIPYVENLCTFFKENTGLIPSAVEHAFLHHRIHFAHRMLFRFKSLSELTVKLTKFIESNGRKGYFKQVDLNSDSSVSKLFKRYSSLKKTIEQLMLEQETTVLFELWAAGVDDIVNYTEQNRPNKRTSLPAFPFLLNDFWSEHKAADASEKTCQENFNQEKLGQTKSGQEKSNLETLGLEKSNAKPSESRVITEQQLQTLAVNQLGQLIKRFLPDYPQALVAESKISSLALDSITIMSLNAELSRVFTGIPQSIFYEMNTLADFAEYLIEQKKPSLLRWLESDGEINCDAFDVSKRSRSDASITVNRNQSEHAVDHLKNYNKANNDDMIKANNEPVAIIGIVGRYPQASDLAQFWHNLVNGKNCVSEIPTERWPMDGFFQHLDDPMSAAWDWTSYSKWGGFLEEAVAFDPTLFGISPAEARAMDPQERLFLETCWTLFEDAGYNRDTLLKQHNNRVAVLVGVTKNGYEHYTQSLHAANANYMPRTSFSSIANRVSYIFDLKGLSMAVDTMCSSSLTAIHLACEQVQSGMVDMAIAGGVNLYLHPYTYLTMSGVRMLANDGKCKSFSAAANGIVPGEGVGAVLLKSLSQAERDGDAIRAVILGSGVNHGGYTNGYTVPSQTSQCRLIQEVLSGHDIAPESISYVEAHGTGTRLGDPIEIAALTEALSPIDDRHERSTCYVGSVKSNIGHLEAAAGIAGLSKIVLQFENQVLAPTLHCEPINPAIEFMGKPVEFVKKAMPWNINKIDEKSICHSRRAALSSFGAGGANAHLVVEEYPGVSTQSDDSNQVAQLIPLSARSQAALYKTLNNLHDFLIKAEDGLRMIDLSALAFTLQTGRESFSERALLVVSSVSELLSLLKGLINKRPDLDHNKCFMGSTEFNHQKCTLIDSFDIKKQALTDWLEQANPKPIANLWMRGRWDNWESLIQGQSNPVSRRRMPLPGMVFKRQNFPLPNELINHSRDLAQVNSKKSSVNRTEASGSESGNLESSNIETRNLESKQSTFGVNSPVASRRCVEVLEQWSPLDFSTMTQSEQFSNRELTSSDLLVIDLLSISLCEQQKQTLDADQILTIDELAQKDIAQIYSELVELLINQLQQFNGNPPELFQCLLLTGSNRQLDLLEGLGALFQTASQELPGSRFQFLFSTSTDLTFIKELLNKIAPLEEIQIIKQYNQSLAYRKLSTQENSLVNKDFLANQKSYQKGTYIITGGLGGLGKIFAKHILVHGEDARVLLLGRSPLADAQQAIVDELSVLGKVIYCQVDISNKLRLRQVIAEFREAEQPIRGVIHSAGVLRDGLIANLTGKDIQQVLQPKVNGTLVLDEVTAADPLDFFVCFSSLASTFGHAGQATYAVANSFMEALCRSRHKKHLKGERQGHSQSICWPHWNSDGMAISAEVTNKLREQLGMLAMEAEEGIALFNQVRHRSGCSGFFIKEDKPVETTKAAKPTPAIHPVGIAEVTADVRLRINDILGIEAEQIDADQSFFKLGMNSVSAMQLQTELLKYYPQVGKKAVFQYQTLSSLSQHIVSQTLTEAGNAEKAIPKERAITEGKAVPEENPGQQSENFSAPFKTAAEKPVLNGAHLNKETVNSINSLSALKAPRVESEDTEIAIIAIAGLFPSANSVETFWQALETPCDLISGLPDARKSWFNLVDGDDQAALDPQVSAPTVYGGFLSDIDKFDPEFFSVTRNEARMMDPQQRLFLTVCHQLFETSGYSHAYREQSCHHRVGVYVGGANSLYANLFTDREERAIVSAISNASIANRVSYFFGLEGPSVVIDSMCSSSMSAIDAAVRDLGDRRCDMAIAGGTNLSLHGDKYLGQSITQLIGSDLTSRSFSQGDGYLPSESVCAVLLKPLAEAEAHADEILAVIPSIQVKHTGNGASFTTPELGAMCQALNDTLAQAGVSIADIGYVEAAANGAPLVDSLEFEALSQVFQQTDRHGSVAIGAVKGIAGHAEAASTMIQLAKVIHQCQTESLLPNYVPDHGNDAIDWDDSPFQLVKYQTPWKTDSHGQRLALINSLGAGGTYGCMLVREYQGVKPSFIGEASDSVQWLLFSAPNQDALQHWLQQIVKMLHQQPDLNLQHLASVLRLRREHYKVRIVVVVKDVHELLTVLDEYLSNAGEKQSGRIWFGENCRECCSESSREGSRESFHKTREQINATSPTESLALNRELLEATNQWCRGKRIDWTRYFSRPLSLPGIELPSLKLNPISCFPKLPASLQSLQKSKINREKINGQTSDRLQKDVPKHNVSCVDSENSYENQINLEQNTTDQLMVFFNRAIGEELPKEKWSLALGELGINSLMLQALRKKVEQQFAINPENRLFQPYVTFQQLFDSLSSELAKRQSVENFDSISNKNQVEKSLENWVLTSSADQMYEPFPLTDLQNAILAGKRLQIGNDRAGCHIYLEFELTDLDHLLLNQCWNRLISLHPMLSVTILKSGEQKIAENRHLYKFNHFDFSAFDDVSKRNCLKRLRDQYSHFEYTYKEDQLYNIVIVKLDQYKSRILFSIDEALVDALSLELLLQQWMMLYREPKLELIPPNLSFRDVVLATKSFEQTEHFKQKLSQAIEVFANRIKPLELPVRTELVKQASYRREKLTFTLESSRWQGFKHYANRISATETELLLTLFCDSLAKYAGQEFTLNMTYVNRPPIHDDIYQVVGPFISSQMLPIRLAQESLESKVASISRALDLAMTFSDVNSVRLLRELKSAGKLSANFSLPIVFSSMLNLTSLIPTESQAVTEQDTFEMVYKSTQTPQIFLDHQLFERAGNLLIVWDYSPDYFADGFVEQLFSDFCRSIDNLINETDLNDAESSLSAGTDLIEFPSEHYDFFPLTVQQQAYGFTRSHLQQENFGCLFYCEVNLTDIDVTRLEASWNKLVSIHPALNMEVAKHGQQRFLKAWNGYSIRVHDLRSQPLDRENKLQAVKQRLMHKVTPLGELPYFIIEVSLLGQGQGTVHFVIDMLIADGRSIKLILEQWMSLYLQPEQCIKRPAFSFRDYVITLEAKKDSHEYQIAKDYWNNKFAAFCGGPELPKPSIANEDCHVRLSHELNCWSNIESSAEQWGVNTKSILLTCYLQVLAEFAKEPSFEVVIPGWQRLPLHPDVDQIIGDFTSMSWIQYTPMSSSFLESAKGYSQQLKKDEEFCLVNGIEALRRFRNSDGDILVYNVVFSEPMCSSDSASQTFDQIGLNNVSSKTAGVHIDNITDILHDRVSVHWDIATVLVDVKQAEQMFNQYISLLELLGNDDRCWQEPIEILMDKLKRQNKRQQLNVEHTSPIN